MSPVQVVVLALVQAVTEFLPISSSGHLILIPRLLGWADQGLAFDIATHSGTFVAILIYFRRDLLGLARGWLEWWRAPREPISTEARVAWGLLWATLPAAVVGALFHERIAHQARNPVLVAVTAIGYGLLLGLADWRGRKVRDLGSLRGWEGFVIGCAQALALVPGTSRSGITMTAALLLGFRREEAARYSFLLVVPISFLVGAKDLLDLVTGALPGGLWRSMALGLTVSAVAGYGVISGLLAWVREHSLTPFVVYRVVLGAVLLVFFRS